MKELLDKFSAMAGQSEIECKVASTISTAYQSVRNSTVSVQTKKGDGVGDSLFQSAKLDFSTETNEEADSKFLKTLSFLIISKCHNDELQLLRTSDGNTAPQSPLLVNLGNPSEKSKFVPKAKQSHTGVKPKQVNASQPNKGKDENAERPQTEEGAKKSAKPVPGSSVRSNMIQKKPSLPDATIQSPAQHDLAQINLLPLDGLKLNTKIDKCFLTFSVNGMVYGKVVIQLRPDVAPIMSQRFAYHCSNKQGQSFINTIIYSVYLKIYIYVCYFYSVS